MKESHRHRLAEFRDAVSKYFAPVAAYLGLNKAVERLLFPDIEINFGEASKLLAITYELESGPPWVHVVVSTAGGHERHFGLHALVECRLHATEIFSEIARMADLQAQVRALADLSREHAGALINREITNVREIYLLQRRALRKREQFESERLEMASSDVACYKPTLVQLFQAATSRDLRSVVAYHAVLDYGYTAGEVASFLGVRETSVQEMIDRHDTLN